MVFGQTLRIWSTLGWYDSGDFCFHRHYHYWLSWVECVGMMMLPMTMFLFVSVRFTLSELILCFLSFFSAPECWDCAGFGTLLLSVMVPLAYLCACALMCSRCQKRHMRQRDTNSSCSQSYFFLSVVWQSLPVKHSMVTILHRRQASFFIQH